MKQKNKKEDFQVCYQVLQELVLLGKLLAGKVIVRAGSGNKKGEGIVRADTGTNWDF